MKSLILVYTVFGSAGEAQATARTLISERLVACANMLAPCMSIYEWEGEVREAEEFPVLFKTDRCNRYALVERLTALHSYDVPAILSWDVSANMPFTHWVGEQVRA